MPIHFSADGRWLWVVSSSWDETTLTRIDVTEARLSRTTTVGAHGLSEVRVLDGPDEALLLALPDGRFLEVPLGKPSGSQHGP